MLGRHVDDVAGASASEGRVKMAQDAARKRLAETDKAIERTEKQLVKLRGRESENAAEVSKTKKAYAQKRTAARAKHNNAVFNNPNNLAALDAEYKKELARLKAAEGKDLNRLQGKANSVYADIDKADGELGKENRRRRINKVREETAGSKRNFANIFDYAATMDRLRGLIIGTTYDRLSKKEVETNLEKKRSENLWARGLWRRVLGSSKAPTEHLRRCHEHVCSSLGIHPKTITYQSVMVLRFMNTYAPMTPGKTNTDAMRLSAFVVPVTAHWTPRTIRHPILRTMANIIRFDVRRVSTFGRLTIATPTRIDPASLEERPKASATVEMSRVAMARNTNLFRLND
eukprot:2681936-Prymnesium_polylepis.1